ncbi:MAG: SHOCT domain-containing protein [Clostridia bacterium]|nr:SHOCT domain-containing protein [Clostridia bacterium]
MDENTIIKSERFKSSLVIAILVLISICIPVLYIIFCKVIYGEYTLNEFFTSDGAAFIPQLLAPIFFVVSLWAIFFTEIEVTNKRVFGKTMFGKRVDLPIDSISSVGFSAFHGIFVGTSSGRISFALVSNNKEIHKCINDLLMKRQGKGNSNVSLSELEQCKELLDKGILTQEEFEAKKKQLLGI